MPNYIRGCKSSRAYTKWDADSENVDMDLDSMTYDQGDRRGAGDCFSGRKGFAIKILSVVLILCLGLVVGYAVGKARAAESHSAAASSRRGPSSLPYALDEKLVVRIQELISNNQLRSMLENVTREPHLSGRESGLRMADFVLRHFESSGLESVRVETFNVLLSYPSSNQPNRVSIVDSDNNTVFISSESGEDPMHPDLRPYIAYSPNGTAQGRLIYANYATRSDFDTLRRNNVSVEGCVVVARLGRGHRANKIKLASDRGAVAVLLYPDPSDFVGKRAVYPDGLGLPPDGILRGSARLYPGDPGTPDFSSAVVESNVGTRGGLKENLPRIPVQPISYLDAQHLMKNMNGSLVPSDWKGALNLTYRFGPGYATPNQSYFVRVEVFNGLERKLIHNVIGVIRGRIEPDRYVIIGSHHDSWTSGASDPGTGLASHLTLVEAFGNLKRSGWQPGRTLIFASWDAEEFGMIGSTEWLEEHAQEMRSRTVAYLNLDSSVVGNRTLHALASPLLRSALFESAKQVLSGEPMQGDELTVYDVWLARNSDPRSSPEPTPLVDSLGSGSDFVSFMSTHGISSAHIQYVGQEGIDGNDYPLYHSAYDSFDAVTRLVDPGLTAMLAVTRVTAVTALRLSDSVLLPFSVSDYGRSFEEGLETLRRRFADSIRVRRINLDPLNAAVVMFRSEAGTYRDNFSAVTQDDELLGYHEFNDRLLEIERALLLPPQGNCFRKNQRHTIFGPDPRNEYQGVTFALIVQSFIRAQEENTEVAWKMVEAAVLDTTLAVRRATAVLSNSVLTGRLV